MHGYSATKRQFWSIRPIIATHFETKLYESFALSRSSYLSNVYAYALYIHLKRQTI